MLDKLNLIAIGLASYNFRNHVASDIPSDYKYLPVENINSQNIANEVLDWTKERKMKLNNKKSNIMIFNFTKNFKFHTRVMLENQQLEVQQETKLLGCIITSDLK